ncbi:hypothetical protein [Thiocapsa sp.]|uniref:hypothetical protein n=1 Tax=Thiocapsa sp. TaxID=2024551 RepID=UPI0025D819F0|nr:hypothetical protein [Thiocapsa sp.]
MLLSHCEPCSTSSGSRLAIPLLLAGILCGPRAAVGAEAAGPPPVDACALLTKADVEAVYGSIVGEPNGKELGSGPFWVSMCNYDNAHTDAPMLSVGLLVKAHGAADPTQAYADYADALRRELGDVAVSVPVEGLAGPAGWDAETGQLTVFEGPYQIILTAAGRFSGDRRSFGKQIAERVSGRLPKP